MGATPELDERIVICAPSVHDGPVTASVLREAGLQCIVVHSVAESCQELRKGAAALILAEEALADEDSRCLVELLQAQEPWSGLPVLLLSAGDAGAGDDALARVPVAASLAVAANVTVLDRPLRVLTLVSAARAALRARRRQYAARTVLQELRGVLDAVPAAVFISRDREARDIRGNRYSAEVLRVAPDSNVSKTAPPEERPRSYRALKDGVEIAPEELPVQRVAASGVEVRNYGFEIEYEDGEVRHLYGNVVPLVGTRGQAHGAVGAFLDVTELRRAEAALRESEARFRTVIGHSRDGISQLDLSTGQYVLVSPAQIALTGFSEPELRGMTPAALLERVHPEDRDIPLRPQRAIAAGEEPESTVEYRWKVKSGDYRWFSDSRKLVRNERGEPVALVGVTRDITESKRSETELRLADQRKSDFLAVLSHELRNPLAPISNSVHILERAQPGSELAKRGLEVLRRQTEHLARLVDDLLDVTRISHGKIELRLERLDARELVARAVEDARQAFEQRGLALWFSGTVEPAWVEADSSRVVQMVGNLLNNALKFTPPGGRVEVSVGRESGSVSVSVRDSGAGITPDELIGIFDPFVQAERTREQRRGGLGIGLGLVRALAEKHGGSIRAHSEGPGRGATFVLSLPEAAPPRELPWSASASPSVPPLSILIIEDNEDAAWTLRDLLELCGHEVTVATRGNIGMERALALSPDVILCDVGLPDITGYDVIRGVRKAASEAEARRAFAVALTGYAQPQDDHDALAAGFDAHLAKPARLEELQLLLAEAARRKHIRLVNPGEQKRDPQNV